MKTEHKNFFFWLMIFKEVIEHESFTAAAAHLNLTKSGVSQHVSRLEQHLGIQLIIRSTRNLHLTAAGETLFQRSVELKTLLDVSLDEINHFQQKPSGRLSITAPQALIRSAVLPALKKLVQQFPHVDPNLLVDDGNQDIIKQGIDVAVRVGSLEDSELKARKISHQKEVVVASTAYLSSTAEPITAQTIAQHPYIATSWQTTNYTHLFMDTNQLNYEVRLKPKYEVNSANVAMELVLLDLGLALLPDTYVHQYIKAGKIQIVDTGIQAQADEISCVHGYHQNVPLKVKWFMKFLKNELEQIRKEIT